MYWQISNARMKKLKVCLFRRNDYMTARILLCIGWD